MLTIDLALAGIGVGAVAALAGLGLIVTYRVTGVFNLGFGAVAVVAAYLLWEAVRVWHWPLALATAADLFIVCPFIGLLLDRAVFRPLQRRGAPPAESLVASLGVFVLLVGTVTLVWGSQARPDAPALISAAPIKLGAVTMRRDTLLELGAVIVVGAGLAAVMRTRFGLLARAVVEQRSLAELAEVDADGISAVAWVIGAFLAGLSGILLAPSLRLDPYGLTLVVMETMAVVVVARLISPVLAIATGLLLGVAQSELTRFHLRGQHASVALQSLSTNLFVVALLIALLALRRLEEPGGRAGTAGGITARLAARRRLPPPRGWWVAAMAFLGIPFLLTGPDLRSAEQVPALAVIFVSIVVVTGYTGQISLGQAGFAGLGALLAAKLSHGQFAGLPAVTGAAAIAVSVVLVGLFGLLANWPAIRRRGLFLALTTFSIAVVVNRFVLAQSLFVTNVRTGPPSGFSGDRAFYLFELGCLGLALLVVRNHHRGRLGRALLAVRDDEYGADAAGVDAHRLRLWAFAVSSGLAALGGALLAASARAFDASTFDPIQGLIWFAAVVVFGVDSAAGAVLGSALIVGVDSAGRAGTSTLMIGVGAVLIGRLRGGLLYSARLLLSDMRGRVRAPPLATPRPVRLSPAGRILKARLGR